VWSVSGGTPAQGAAGQTGSDRRQPVTGETGTPRIPNPRRPSRFAAWLLLCGGTLLITGCGQQNAYQAPPPPEVIVSPPIRQDVTSYREYTGTTRAIESVELRARVKGFLESIHFRPGANVRQGDLLFVIDPKPFQSKVDQAKADLASKQATLENMESELMRSTQLRQRAVLTEQDFIKSKTDRDAAFAAVAAARATLEQASLDLGYTRVVAPISGKISRNLVDVGNLVGDAEATVLAAIVKYDPIYAYWTVSESDLLSFKQMVRDGKRIDYQTGVVTIDLGMADEEGFPHQGVLEYADPAVDAATGTVQARAVFQNSEEIIVPGLFVRVRIPFEEQKNSLLVPERAIGNDQLGRYIYVVNKENTVEQRTVKVGTTVAGMCVIKTNLQADELVIVNGLQRARPGVKVTPKAADILPGTEIAAPEIPRLAPADSMEVPQIATTSNPNARPLPADGGR